MFSITSLTIISLIGTTVIEYGSTSYTKEDASTECEDMMAGYVFDTDSTITGGKINFKTSYFDLTSNIIESDFSQNQEYEEPQDIAKKLLQRELFSQYFLDLNLNHDMELERKSIKDWCKQKSIEENEKIGIYDKYLLNMEAQRCEKKVKGEFEINDTKTPKEIFNLFYNDWTINFLRKDRDNVPTSTMKYTDVFGSNITITSNAAKNYPLKFFEYYGEKATNPVVAEGFFRTIKEFCDFSGYEIVSEKATS